MQEIFSRYFQDLEHNIIENQPIRDIGSTDFEFSLLMC